MYTIYHFVSSVSIIARSFFIRFSLWRPWRFMLLVGILMSMFSLVLLLCKLEEPYKTLEEKKILQTYLFFFFLQQRGEKCLTSLLQAPQVRAMAVNKVQQKLYSMSRFCLPVNLLPCVRALLYLITTTKRCMNIALSECLLGGRTVRDTILQLDAYKVNKCPWAKNGLVSLNVSYPDENFSQMVPIWDNAQRILFVKEGWGYVVHVSTVLLS